ncbi:MAG: hypothetical protein ACPGSI_16625 [Pikeienuella sp.]
MKTTITIALIFCASTAWAINDTPDTPDEPDTPSEPTPTGEVAGGDEGADAGTTTCELIPNPCAWTNDPTPITDQNYGGKM